MFGDSIHKILEKRQTQIPQPGIFVHHQHFVEEAVDIRTQIRSVCERLREVSRLDVVRQSGAKLLDLIE